MKGIYTSPKARRIILTREQAIEIITNALQSDERRYTEEIDKALAIVQQAVEDAKTYELIRLLIMTAEGAKLENER